MSDQPRGGPPDPAVPHSADPGPYARAAWKVRLAVAAFSVSLVLVAGESLARRFAPPEPPPLLREHPLVGLVPTAGALVNPGAPAERRASFALDALGLRGANLLAREKPRGTYRILFLGDEQTLASGTPEEDTFPGRVERELKKIRGEADLDVQVGNAGLPGASSPVLHAHLVHRLLALEPDLVVVSCSAADLRLSQSLGSGDAFDAFAARPRPVPGFLDWLASVSELGRLFRSRLASAPAPLVGPLAASPDPKRGLAVTRRYLHLMALACKDAHCDLAFATQPALWKTVLSPEERRTLRWPTATGEKGPGSAEELASALDAWNDEVRSAAHREGATLVDLAPAEVVPRNLSHFEDDLTLTPIGHAVVARTFVTVVFADKPATRRP